jgi:hypothetical protein
MHHSDQHNLSLTFLQSNDQTDPTYLRDREIFFPSLHESMITRMRCKVAVKLSYRH